MTFKERLRIRIMAESLGLLAKYSDERKVWEIWEVKNPKGPILEPTRKIWEGKRVKSFLKKRKGVKGNGKENGYQKPMSFL